MPARISLHSGAIAAVGLSLALGACGDSDSGGATAAANDGGPQVRGIFALTSKQRSCLKEQGVTLPDPQRRQGGPPDGAPPPTDGQPRTDGQPPPGVQRFGADSTQAKKLQAAFKKCGVALPNRPGPGQQQQDFNAPAN